MGTRLHPTTRTLLRSLLGEHHAAIPFAEAVTAHIGLIPEEPGHDLVRESEAAARVADVLGRLHDGLPVSAPLLLDSDPALLASFFQNADLLAPGGRDALLIARLLNEALDRSDET